MLTITQPYQSDYRIKGSKFLGTLSHAETVASANRILETIRSEHPTATHHCYAWRINPNEPEEFDQDDGEPKGTAGLPILNAMRSAGLMNCILVSVRYFGGTKLGKPGLIDAYGTSASLCIERARLKKIIPVSAYKIVYDYPHQGVINKLKNDFSLIELDSTYLDKVEIRLGCPAELRERFEGALQSFLHLFENVDNEGSTFLIGE